MRLLSLAALATLLVAGEARAQFTTYVEPPRRTPRAISSAIADAARRARADSLRRAAIVEMKAWVDSAAAALEAGGADTSRVPRTRPDTARPPRARPDTSRVRRTRPDTSRVEREMPVAGPAPFGGGDRPSSVRAQYFDRSATLPARRARA